MNKTLDDVVKGIIMNCNVQISRISFCKSFVAFALFFIVSQQLTLTGVLHDSNIILLTQFQDVIRHFALLWNLPSSKQYCSALQVKYR